ncbi:MULTISPECIES: DEAD/DEAH box helicase [Pseudomonadota]|uniref:DEAD/DEAH box helicase n=1 Tax=Pseudomonadota TaxID=1224 RepID=UPI001FB75B23|nr:MULTISPECIES: DEAD/DEAH box helicase [Pseudomonadota]
MTTQQLLTPHQSQYFAWLLTRRAAGDSVESLASTLVDSQVDLNPHQVEAALFACRNPLSRGVILADEVGLGKTIEAGLVISQRWAERRRKMLIIVPANLRKQWHQELQDKFGLQGLILEAKNYNAIRKQERQNPFLFASGPIICSYQFAKAKADDVKGIDWDLVVLDEAHRLRNVYKTSNVIAKTLKEALSRVHSKVLLTATPLQNSLLELYGLVSFIDDRVFGDLDSFRSQFTGREQSFSSLRDRLAPICKRTLRKQVQPYVSYTARRAIVEEFTPSGEEQELSRLVADYLRRPNLKALPDGQRQLISLVLWKLLASSTHAIAGALETMAKRLQGVLNQAPVVPDLAEELDEDYESLDETADEWEDQEPGTEATNRSERDAIAQEIEELRHFKTLATNIRDNAKGKALLTALVRAFAELDRLGAARKAIIFTECCRSLKTDQMVSFRCAPTVTETSRIKQMLFGGFARCLYPLQKFDSDTERRFAIILERDATKWLKPAKGQFQIYYKLGTEQPEYIPDFVAETDPTIFMVETKARADINTQEVQAKAAAAARWCVNASDHASSVGSKPWKYLLVPHDEVSESKRLADYLRFEVKT